MDEVNVNTLFGRMCEDKISRTKGICIGIVDHLFGCREVVLQKEVKKKDSFGNLPNSFNISRIEVLNPEPEINMEIPVYKYPPHLGKFCRDKVTGYEGYCLSCMNIFFSSQQYYLQAPCKGKKKDKVEDAIWIDEGRLEVLSEKGKISKEEVSTPRAGGVDAGFPGIGLPDIT